MDKQTLAPSTIVINGYKHALVGLVCVGRSAHCWSNRALCRLHSKVVMIKLSSGVEHLSNYKMLDAKKLAVRLNFTTITILDHYRKYWNRILATEA